jgi:hypothetical protein
MAALIAANPLRAPLVSELAPIAIAYHGPTATGAYADAQTTCPLVRIAGDLTECIMTRMLANKFGSFTLPGLCSIVQAQRTCKYIRDVWRNVSTPIDAAIVDRHDAVSTQGDSNLNRQRFILYALQRPDGHPAGIRFRLVSDDMVARNQGVVPEERADDPFLVVYRDVRQYYDRPVVMAMAKPQDDGSLVCIELSLREMLLFMGGHSKKSVFNAVPAVVRGVVRDRGLFQYANRDTEISVWGSTEAKLGLVPDSELYEDSLNPISMSVQLVNEVEPVDAEGARLLSRGQTLAGARSHRFNGVVTFSFPESTSTAFRHADAFHLALDAKGKENVATFAILLGCDDDPSVAAMPTSKGPMIANSMRWNPERRNRRGRNDDSGHVSIDNILPASRRVAVQCADLKIQCLAADDNLMRDGQYLPGHPEYERIRAELDELNARNREQGKVFKYVDPRLAAPSVNTGRRRGSVRTVLLQIAN